MDETRTTLAAPVSGPDGLTVAPTRRPASQQAIARLVSGTTRAVPDLVPTAAIVAAVLLGNALFLVGAFNPNPINVFSGLGVVHHAGVFPGTYPIDPNNGFTSQALGHLAALDLLHGHLPWWNPYEGVGSPLAGEMQSAALFPGTLLLVFSTGQLYLHLALECLAGVATFRLLLRLHVGRWIGAACGAAFALNGTFAWFGHAPVNPVAFLPLVLLGVERSRSAATSALPHTWAMISVGVALSVYAGFPEVAYLDGLLVAAWVLVRSIGLQRDALVAYWRKLAAGIGVGILLSLPIVVAFGDYLRSANVGSHATGFNSASLPHASVSMLLFPYSFGPVFGFVSSDKTGLLNIAWGNVGGYLTTVIFALAVIGLYNRRLRSLRIVLAAWILVSLGRTFGIEPFARVFGLLPFMNNVAAFRYLPPSWELAAIVLAALGLDDLRRKAVPRWYSAVALAGCVLAAIGMFVAGGSLRAALAQARDLHLWVLASALWGFGMIAVVAVAVLALRGRLRMVVLLGVLVLDVLVMFVVPELSAPRDASIDTGPVVWLEQHLGDQRFYTLGPIAPNYGSYFRLRSADINDVPIPRAYGKYITSHLDSNDDPSLFVGNYLLDPNGPTPLHEFFTNMANYESIGVAYLVTFPGQVPSPTAQSSHLRLVYSDNAADIYRLPTPKPLFSVASGACTLRSTTSAQVVADCRTHGAVTRRELYMPGWSVTLNGRSQTVGRRGLFQSVALAPGRSVLEFTFLPPYESEAFAGFLVGLALLVWGLWSGRLRRARHARANR